MLGPQKLPKNDQEPKKQLPRQFFDSQEAKNDDSGPPRKRRPKTGWPKTWILDDCWLFLNAFLRGFCITCRCWQCVQKVQEKSLFPPMGVVFHSHGKTSNNMLKTTLFHAKSIQKRDRPKYAPKPRFSSFFEGPKRLKTDHFEVKIASSTSNGTILKGFKKLFQKPQNVPFEVEKAILTSK